MEVARLRVQVSAKLKKVPCKGSKAKKKSDDYWARTSDLLCVRQARYQLRQVACVGLNKHVYLIFLLLFLLAVTTPDLDPEATLTNFPPRLSFPLQRFMLMVAAWIRSRIA